MIQEHLNVMNSIITSYKRISNKSIWFSPVLLGFVSLWILNIIYFESFQFTSKIGGCGFAPIDDATEPEKVRFVNYFI